MWVVPCDPVVYLPTIAILTESLIETIFSISSTQSVLCSRGYSRSIFIRYSGVLCSSRRRGTL
ncbi:MAG: hypothetical protein A4E50_00993 [Methanosaeta sp. PtaB.Bin087]|nr:MAG: hypothetical protein A4E50_00993 [Methanosaeta sp. PtaB.Bin087]